ncbi:MAG: SPASM domain-containing protein, partial [Candidatus Omnitrophica bacterium]|nr:SPASM domain-containing protein [Candidatus Omnitrophota bacterium]
QSLPFYLATNLTVQSKNLRKQLLLCDNIDITFLAPTKKKYDRLQCSRSKSQFNTVVKNIEYIASHKRINNKPKINLMYIVNRQNYLYLKDMLKLAKSIGADSLELQPFDPAGKNKQLALNPKEMNHFLKIKKNLKEYKPFLDEKFFDSYYSLKLNDKNLNSCYMGYFTMLVAVKGLVKIGCFDPKSPTAGNVYRQKLSQIWHSKKAQQIRNSYIDNLDKIHKSNSHCPFLIRNKELNNYLKKNY